MAVPAALVASQSYRAAAISAAAVGSCRSSQPGACPGGTPDRFNNLVYSLQSISHSILGGLEVVGNRVSKIGNALQKFRAVGEKAYGWMNPQTSFQNRFFTGLQATTETVEAINQVSSEVLSVRETITQLTKQKDELAKSVSEDAAGARADAQPEATVVKAEATAAKVISKTPDIPESAQTKP